MKVLLLIVAMATACYCQAQKASRADELYNKGQSLEQTDRQASLPVYFEAIEAGGTEDLQLKALIRILKITQPSGYIEKITSWSKKLSDAVQKEGRQDSLASEFLYSAGVYHEDILNQVESSLKYYHAALTIRQALYGEQSARVAECYQGIGDVYKYISYDFDTAEEYYEKSLSIREKLTVQDDLALATNYYSLAVTNRSQNDFDKAIAYLTHTITLVTQLNHGPFLEISYGALGNTYRDMGQTSKAKQYYRRSIAMNEKNRKRKINGSLALHFQNLGETLLKEKNYDSALLILQEAVKMNESLQTRSNLVYSLQQLGMVYAATEKYDEAILTYGKAFRMMQTFQLNSTGQKAELLQLTGDAFRKKNTLDSAIAYYQNALVASATDSSLHQALENPSLQTIALPNIAFKVLVSKAEILFERYKLKHNAGDAEKSLECFALAESLLTQSRRSLDMDKSKFEFVDTRFGLYEKHLSVLTGLIQTKRADSLITAAFYCMEGSKSKGLADALTTAEAAHPELLGDSLLFLLNKYKTVTFNLQDQLTGNLSPERATAVRTQLVEIDREIRLTEDAIQLKNPTYLEVKFNPKLSSPAEVRAYLGDRDAALLEFFWGHDFIYGIALNEKEIVFRQLGRTEALGAVIVGLLSKFQDSSTNNLETFRNFCVQGRETFQQLVEPFSAQLSGKKRLIIVPDGIIAQIPFEVLLTSTTDEANVNYAKLPYLLWDHAISYSFSSTHLVQRTERYVESPAVLGIGYSRDSLLKRDDSPLTYRSDQDSVLPASLPDIGGAMLEMKILSNLFGGSTILVGGEATESNFKTLSPDFDILHLAMHGSGDVEEEFSSKLFFRPSSDTLEDGELHWYELYALKLNTSLAVLSSCESGIGKGYKGEGMLSMANAFTYAGCQNLVMGLWKVNDRVSVRLMDSFYSNLLQGERIDDALTNAKREYLALSDEYTADPRLWAALTTYGNQSIIEKKTSQWKYIAGISIGLILLWMIVARARRS